MSAETSNRQNSSRRYFLFWLAVVFANTLFHLWYIWKGPLDLFPDEAHYWEWSRRPEISYYSKGPIVAYVILIFTTVFGTSAFTVRMGAALLSVASGFLIFRLGKVIFHNEKVGFYATAMLFLMPLINAGTFIMTIDAPFVFFWTLTIFAAYRALRGGKGWWYLAGAAAGFGSLSKYTMLFIWPSLLLYFLLSRDDRRWLRRKEFYLSFLLCTVLFSPVLLWNAKNNWVSFRHLMAQAEVHEGFRISPGSFFEFVGSQVGVVTPFFFFALMYALWRRLRDGIRGRRHEYLYLFSCAAVMLASYLLKGLQGKTEPNWVAAAYVPGAILCVEVVHERMFAGAPGRARRTLRLLSILACIFAFLIVLVGHGFGLLRAAGIRIPYSRDPSARAIGWKELGQKVSGVYLDMKAKGPTFIFSDRYQTTSELAFYVVGRPRTYNVNLGRRLNQYDFWNGLEKCIGWGAIFVHEGDSPLPGAVGRAFHRCEGEALVRIERFGLPVKTFSVFRCFNLVGFKEKPRGTTY